MLEEEVARVLLSLIRNGVGLQDPVIDAILIGRNDINEKNNYNLGLYIFLLPNVEQCLPVHFHD